MRLGLAAAGLILAGAMPAARRHAGAPVWMDLVISEGEVLLKLHGEPEPLRTNLGLTTPLAGPMATETRALVRERITEVFRDRHSVRIDGEPVQPVLRELTIPVDTPTDDGWMVVVADLAYACEGEPRSVTVTWKGFEGAEWMGDVYIPVLVKHGRYPEMFSLYPEEPEFTWHTQGARPARPVVAAVMADDANDAGLPGVSLGLFALAALAGLAAGRARGRRIPALSLGLGAILAGGLLWNRSQPRFEAPWRRGVAIPAEEQALTLFDTLHRNIYAAFDARSEDEIYDLLAISVVPGLLDDLYGEVYESLILREDGGAVCSIQEIEMLERSVDFHPAEIADARDHPAAPQARFDVNTSWRVHGLVAHWGHTHRRVNQYRATYAVQHDGHSWKIAAVEVQDHARVDEDG